MMLESILFYGAILAYRLAPLGLVAILALLFFNRRKRQRRAAAIRRVLAA